MTRTYPSAEEITIDPVVFEKLRVLGAAAGQDFLTDLVDQFVYDTGPLLTQLRGALAAVTQHPWNMDHDGRGCGHGGGTCGAQGLLRTRPPD